MKIEVLQQIDASADRTLQLVASEQYRIDGIALAAMATVEESLHIGRAIEESIVLTKLANGSWAIRQGRRYYAELGWDEALGAIASMFMGSDRRPLRTAVETGASQFSRRQRPSGGEVADGRD